MFISVSTLMIAFILIGLAASIAAIVFIILETGITDKYTVALTCCCAAVTACLIMVLILYMVYYYTIV